MVIPAGAGDAYNGQYSPQYPLFPNHPYYTVYSLYDDGIHHHPQFTHSDPTSPSIPSARIFMALHSSFLLFLLRVVPTAPQEPPRLASATPRHSSRLRTQPRPRPSRASRDSGRQVTQMAPRRPWTEPTAEGHRHKTARPSLRCHSRASPSRGHILVLASISTRCVPPLLAHLRPRPCPAIPRLAADGDDHFAVVPCLAAQQAFADTPATYSPPSSSSRPVADLTTPPPRRYHTPAPPDIMASSWNPPLGTASVPRASRTARASNGA